MSKETVAIACLKCEDKIASEQILSRHPPSCECGNYDYPHSHRGSGTGGLGDVIRHCCAFCKGPLAFDTNRRWSDRVAGTSFKRVRDRSPVRHLRRKSQKRLRRAFALVRTHKMTPEGRTAMKIVNFLREIARNAAKAEEAGEPWTDTVPELLEDIASRIDEGQGWV